MDHQFITFDFQDEHSFIDKYSNPDKFQKTYLESCITYGIKTNNSDILTYLKNVLSITCYNYQQNKPITPEFCQYLIDNNITNIIFSNDNFNHSIDNLPDHIEMIIITSQKFSNHINYLPHNLKTLFIVDNNYFAESYINYLPPNLVNLIINKSILPVDIHFPPTLQFLQFGASNPNHRIDYLPQSLQYLILSEYFNQPINNLPPYLTHLIIGSHFTESLDFLPYHLKLLNINCNYKNQISQLPPNLQKIQLNLGNNALFYKNDQLMKYLKDKFPHIEIEDTYFE